MKNEVYICDFCKTESTVEKAMIGLRWRGMTELSIYDASKGNSHLCHRCLDAIREINFVTPKQQRN